MAANALPDEFETVLVEQHGSVCRVTLNRPDAANSRNQRMREELMAIWSAIDASAEIRAVILAAAGERFFCAGMDTKEAGRHETSKARRARLAAARDIEQLAALRQPTVAAVNGYALGGGLEMALACDLRVAADTAKFGLPEVTVGLVPGGGGTQRLPRVVGLARATELVLTGRRFSAVTALDYGVVTEVVPAAELNSRADALAASLAAYPADAVGAAKRLVRHSTEVPVATGVAEELDALCDLLERRSTMKG